MKFSSTIVTAALAAAAWAETYYVTRVHYITVEANGDAVGTASSATAVTVVAASTDAASATTLLTVRASYASQSVADTSITKSSAATTSTTPTTSSSQTAAASSGIYAEIASSGVDETFAKNILDAHNEKRALHSAGDLSWSATLYDYAQAYADKYTCGGSLVHSGGNYGENLALGYSTGVAALEAWYDEGTDYDYAAASVLDHFTQVVWKGTTKLGCAYKQCSCLYVICSYDPAGNIVGAAAENVLAS